VASRTKRRRKHGLRQRVRYVFAGDNGFNCRDNLHTARINVLRRPRDFRFWSDGNPGVNLRMNRQTGILIDAWNAASADVVRDKIENAGPSSPPIVMPSFDPNHA
jgi:hypothetical protein